MGTSGDGLPPYEESGSSNRTARAQPDHNAPELQETDLPQTQGDRIGDIDYTRKANGSIVSYDPQLNDPILFARFIQHEGAKPPLLSLCIRGTHWEDKYTREFAADANQTENLLKKNDSRQMIVDFDFSIPLTNEILVRRGGNRPPYFYTIADHIPAYRGTTTKKTLKEVDAKNGYSRVETGLSAGQQSIVDYISSPKPLKQFAFEKRVDGWDIRALRMAVLDAVKETGYRGDATVWMRRDEEHVYVRPGNTISKLYRGSWLSIVLWILFPIGLIMYLLDMIYLGAYWQVLGSRFLLYDHRTNSGMSEGAFFQIFRGRIERFVRERRVNDTIEWPTD